MLRNYGTPTATLPDDSTIESVARCCHEANRAYCELTGDPALPAWEALEESDREPLRAAVLHAVRGMTPEQAHRRWMQKRLDQGWRHGAPLDRTAKVHPNLVSYDDLPEAQQRKDALFLGVVEAILGPLR